jgi:hypothetical protein
MRWLLKLVAPPKSSRSTSSGRSPRRAAARHSIAP